MQDPVFRPNASSQSEAEWLAALQHMLHRADDTGDVVVLGVEVTDVENVRRVRGEGITTSLWTSLAESLQQLARTRLRPSAATAFGSQWLFAATLDGDETVATLEAAIRSRGDRVLVAAHLDNSRHFIRTGYALGSEVEHKLAPLLCLSLERLFQKRTECAAPP